MGIYNRVNHFGTPCIFLETGLFLISILNLSSARFFLKFLVNNLMGCKHHIMIITSIVSHHYV